ncbi:hypothetical protein GE21DRAFT_1067627 [Neurospora crassa]|nr:hypothetical protein GE21DRAFT_1067627 [Neurospora crassa]
MVRKTLPSRNLYVISSWPSMPALTARNHCVYLPLSFLPILPPRINFLRLGAVVFDGKSLLCFRAECNEPSTSMLPCLPVRLLLCSLSTPTVAPVRTQSLSVVLRGITMCTSMVNVVSTLWFAILCVVYRFQYAWHISGSVNVSNPGSQGSHSRLCARTSRVQRR